MNHNAMISFLSITVLNVHLARFSKTGSKDLVNFHLVNRRSVAFGRDALRHFWRAGYEKLLETNRQGRLRRIPETLWPLINPYLFPRIGFRTRIVLCEVTDPDLPNLLQPGVRIIIIRPVYGPTGYECGKVVLFLRCYRNCIGWDCVVVLGTATRLETPWYPVMEQLRHVFEVGGFERVPECTYHSGRSFHTAARDTAATAYYFAHRLMQGYARRPIDFKKYRDFDDGVSLFEFIFSNLPNPNEMWADPPAAD
jgi:hypothetical protein